MCSRVFMLGRSQLFSSVMGDDPVEADSHVSIGHNGGCDWFRCRVVDRGSHGVGTGVRRDCNCNESKAAQAKLVGTNPCGVATCFFAPGFGTGDFDLQGPDCYRLSKCGPDSHFGNSDSMCGLCMGALAKSSEEFEPLTLTRGWKSPQQ